MDPRSGLVAGRVRLETAEGARACAQSALQLPSVR